MPVSGLPSPGVRTDPRDVFTTKQIAWQAALPAFTDQLNALESTVVAGAATAGAAASAAAASAALTAFKGAWSGLTGALAMPASVLHGEQFWALATPLADVTTAQPGVHAAWKLVNPTPPTVHYLAGAI